jgi:hypothetical protein
MKRLFAVASFLVICAFGMHDMSTLARNQSGSPASNLGQPLAEAAVAQCQGDTAQLQTPATTPKRVALLEQQSKLVSDPSPASDSCTNWVKQDNGCYWRECVDNNGRQYCEELCGNGPARRVPCK